VQKKYSFKVPGIFMLAFFVFLYFLHMYSLRGTCAVQWGEDNVFGSSQARVWFAAFEQNRPDSKKKHVKQVAAMVFVSGHCQRTEISQLRESQRILGDCT